VLAVAMLGLVAGSASASVASATNPKFCKAVEKIGTNSSSQPTKSEAKSALKGFKKAAKYAPGKVKNALNTIGKYLVQIADGNLEALGAGNNFKNYTSAIGTYVKFYSSTCFGSS
jgi:hypothetical protein